MDYTEFTMEERVFFNAAAYKESIPAALVKKQDVLATLSFMRETSVDEDVKEAIGSVIGIIKTLSDEDFASLAKLLPLPTDFDASANADEPHQEDFDGIGAIA